MSADEHGGQFVQRVAPLARHLLLESGDFDALFFTVVAALWFSGQFPFCVTQSLLALLEISVVGMFHPSDVMQ